MDETPKPRPQSKLRWILIAGVSLLPVAYAAHELGWVKTESIVGYLREKGLEVGKKVSQDLNPISGRKSCVVGNPATCPPENLCAFIEKNKAKCVPRYVGSTQLMRFPFLPEQGAVCIQGAENPEGSHSFENSVYALDLASVPADQAPAVVHSATAGTAIVFQSCAYSTKPGAIRAGSENDDCGQGFGNHIRVLSSDGTMVLYAHLGQIWVQDGQNVAISQELGEEGDSGRVSRRHLHFSVHAVPREKLGENWLETLYHYRTRPGELPPSIPFETQYCDPANDRECVRRRSRVEKFPCKQGDLKQAPLRADWRE